IGQQHQFLGAQRFGHLARHQVGVDVVGGTVFTDADGRDHRNVVVGNQPVYQLYVDLGHFADMADIDDFRLVHAGCAAGDLEFAGADQVGILTGQAEGAAAVLVNQIDDVLVDLAAEHHFHHVHGCTVSDAHAFDELAGDVQALKQITDLRAAAMYHHRIDAD